MPWRALTAMRDLRRLHEIASILIRYGFGDMVRQFAQSLRNELDFPGECHNAEFISENFTGHTDQDSPSVVPGKEKPEADGTPPIIVNRRVYWQWTGERVCVQEFIGGISGRRLQAVDQAAGLDRKVLARRGANAVLKMIVEDGIFHADPHPGNLFYLPGNRIAFIDFGRLAEERRDQLIRLLLGLVRNDARSVIDVMLDWTSDGVSNEQVLLLEVQSFIDRYHGVPLKQLRLSAMLSDLVAIPRQHHLVMPNDLSLPIKAVVTLESLGCELDRGFDMANQALPLLERAMHARYSLAA
jgi:ubiquinone biosynthesis protein